MVPAADATLAPPTRAPAPDGAFHCSTCPAAGVSVGVPAAADTVSNTTPPGPGEGPVIDAEVDVAEVIVQGVPTDVTPENATAPHTNPAAPDTKLFPVMIVLLFGVKPVICQIPTEALPPAAEVNSVTVPPGGLRVMALPALNEFAFVPDTLNKMRLAPVVLRPGRVQRLPELKAADALPVIPMLARAVFGNIVTSADTSRNTGAPRILRNRPPECRAT